MLVTWLLLVVTARYRLLLLVPTFSMSGFPVNFVKFLITLISIEYLWWLVLTVYKGDVRSYLEIANMTNA